ncbi:xanthine dehydrogenase family protein subunit M [Streptomyces sp. RLB3-17]|jgi:xanthine dehydrogenase YagS FAD-binding subunit|uniref:FAD binding domain-containing protein n=1 Tax=Streptomyces TaxID=1883 RepID=UPI001163160A|nr:MULTISPECIES: xanthine dehydrogenase family protein subunit M [Streptomyces]KAF5992342.1 molybdopterin dehydrogenase [Streptomyces sp. WAC00263]MCX4428143.1 xanthine dehydrogenase family protein subunit M [Streptomyces mirabilis]QDN76398.1 xanthine dehydrogenase family protein subunit M [Streptomyces sp. S1A1-7]QDO18475.1 xanthine dehydrogenase family protein subunit M [Streptomyces sp. S1A1-8]QDO28603.1 xanthine dehydrogenase family protein subunit M [Streptomyces sp. S1A1-3]
MREFDYERAYDVTGAVALLGADPDARYLGGGTNLVDLMKSGVERPARLVDVRELPLDRVEFTRSGGLRIGATVTNSDLAAHPDVRRHYPALTQAVLAGASGQLRNMATVGGNLLQRTRCGYFTDLAKPCNKRVPGSGCPAVEGEHHNHAILGASAHCVATHPSDMAVALSAFDAVVSYETADGPGELPLAEFYLPVGDTPHLETALPPGALITGVTLPAAPVAARSRYRKVRERASYAFAIGSIAAALDVHDGVVREVRLAFGAVASRPWRARAAERALTGGPASAEAFAAAADAELAAARTLPHNGYKVPLMRNLVVAMLTELTEEVAR